MIQIDKIELQITQLKKELKKQESEDNKCAYYEILAQIEDLEGLKSKVENSDKVKSSFTDDEQLAKSIGVENQVGELQLFKDSDYLYYLFKGQL